MIIGIFHKNHPFFHFRVEKEMHCDGACESHKLKSVRIRSEDLVFRDWLENVKAHPEKHGV